MRGAALEPADPAAQPATVVCQGVCLRALSALTRKVGVEPVEAQFQRLKPRDRGLWPGKEGDSIYRRLIAVLYTYNYYNIVCQL